MTVIDMLDDCEHDDAALLKASVGEALPGMRRILDRAAEGQLECLLGWFGARRLVLIGQVTEQCVVPSALAAYPRVYEITPPRDAVLQIHADLGEAALAMMSRNIRAEISTARETAL